MFLLKNKICEYGIIYSSSPFLNSSLKNDFNEYAYSIILNAITVLIKPCSMFVFIFLLLQSNKYSSKRRPYRKCYTKSNAPKMKQLWQSNQYDLQIIVSGTPKTLLHCFFVLWLKLTTDAYNLQKSLVFDKKTHCKQFYTRAKLRYCSFRSTYNKTNEHTKFKSQLQKQGKKNYQPIFR